MRNDSEIVVFWSDRMDELIKMISKKFSRSWFLEPDDLSQEAYYAIIYWIGIKGDAPVSIKLFTKIVRNRMHMYLRTFKRPTNRLPLNLVPEPESIQYNHDIRFDVIEALEATTPQQRITLFSQFNDDMSQAEIGKALGLSEEQVGKRNQAAYRRLRAKLGESYGPLELRKREAPRMRKQSAIRNVNWLAWGKIPNQRED